MALNGVSFTVNKGEAVGIIGSNGAGKSTLLKLLTHVTAPTSGDIDLYGRVASMLEVGTGFHPEMTGRENVYLNGAILGMTRAEIDAKMAEIIEFSEVGDFIDTPVKRYSSGMFVKLAFSVAAHLDSEIMIMDEVLAVGDMKFQKKCLTKMRQAARRDGKTVLYVSHNMATIRDLCDRCIVLDKGKVIFDGDVDEGIALYLSTKSQAADFVDYSDFKRDNWFKRDNLRLQSVRVLVPSVEAIERTQPVRIHCVIKAQESVERVGLRLEVRDEVGNPLATSCLYDLNLHEGDSEFTAQYDLSVLSPGKYSNYFTLFTAGDFRFLDTGDAEADVEQRLVDTYGPTLHATLFKAGHHGSYTSNSLTFMQAVRPEAVAVSCGLHNDYGHPHRAALQNYAEVGAEVWRTDLEGSLTFIWQNNTLNVETSADSADFAA